MRPVLENQPQIEALSSPLLGALRALVAAIQTGWNQQHKGDGSHDAVTATGLSVSGATVLNKLNLASATYVGGIGGGIVNDLTAPGLAGVSCLRIDASASPTMITGIDATGRQRGDLLLVLNCDRWLAPKDLMLLGEDTRSLPANRFCDTAASTGGAGATVTVQGARGIWLIYDYQERESNVSPIGPRWRIVTDL